MLLLRLLLLLVLPALAVVRTDMACRSLDQTFTLNTLL
jgi:hypothetical protein